MKTSTDNKAVADDLVQRLRACVRLKASHTWDELIEAADALARKDAEIERLRVAAADNALVAEVYKESACFLRTEREVLRQRAECAEARVREAPVAMVGRDRAGCTAIYPPLGWATDTKVALVLLDTEEAK